MNGSVYIQKILANGKGSTPPKKKMLVVYVFAVERQIILWDIEIVVR